jgi:hypothetical protein
MFSSKSLRFVLVIAAAFHAVPSTAVTSRVDLGGAEDFVIIAETGITSVPASAITGDIGVWPISGAAMTGFDFTHGKDSDDINCATAPQLAASTGKAYAGDYGEAAEDKMALANAAMKTAYNDAAGRTNSDAERINLKGGNIGGETLTTGIYTFTTGVYVRPDTAVTFRGSATDVFIIQIAETLIMSANTQVILTEGAKPENIFWQVAGYAEVGAGATMEGVLLAKTSATFITGSTLNGRVLAQTLCALQMATITEPDAVPVPRRNLLRKGV